MRPGGGRRTLGVGKGDRNLFPMSGSAHWSHVMKWETPQASDMRFGFEITMYIATR